VAEPLGREFALIVVSLRSQGGSPRIGMAEPYAENFVSVIA